MSLKLKCQKKKKKKIITRTKMSLRLKNYLKLNVAKTEMLLKLKSQQN